MHNENITTLHFIMYNILCMMMIITITIIFSILNGCKAEDGEWCLLRDENKCPTHFIHLHVSPFKKYKKWFGNSAVHFYKQFWVCRAGANRKCMLQKYFLLRKQLRWKLCILLKL